MSIPDSSIDPRIIESAKTEFLQHGFKDASLKSICEGANVTTGALYKRYSGKKELFDKVVAPTLDDINSLNQNMKNINLNLLDDNQLQKMWDMSEETHKKWIDFFYERFDGMKLLLCCSEGTYHSNFLHDFVNTNTKHVIAFVEEASKRGIKTNEINEEQLHILLTAYWSAILETIIHDFSKEKATQHMKIIVKFFNWEAIFGF